MLQKMSMEQCMAHTLRSLLDRKIYIGYVPTDEKATITVRRTGGTEQRCYNCTPNSGRVFKPYMQVIVQNPKYEDGMSICQRIVRHLDGITHTGFAAYLQGNIIPLGKRGTLAGEPFMFSINFSCVEDDLIGD